MNTSEAVSFADLAKLSAAQKRELLARLLDDQSASQDQAAPMSFAQERLWFLHQLQPGNPVYNIPIALPMGPVDVVRLERAVQQVVERHGPLRTTFRLDSGAPVQLISATGDVPFTVVDLTDQPEDQRAAIASRYARREALTPFDLEHGPLMRTFLIRISADVNWLLLNLHHVAADGWSVSLLLNELSAFYQGDSLPPIQVSYSDYAARQRQDLRGDGLRMKIATLRKRLRGAPQVLSLPFDRPRPDVESFRGGEYTFTIDKRLAGGLRQLSQQRRTTLFMTLLAALKVLLARYSGSDDIVIGTPAANRTTKEHEPLIGLFVNTMVLRSDLSGSPSFIQLLERVREVTMEAFAHQDVPFEKIVEELKPERSLSHNPIFQVMAVLQNLPQAMQDSRAQSATAEPPRQAAAGENGYAGGANRPELSTGTSKVDLTFTLAESAERVKGHVEYSLDLFDEDTVEQLVGHYLDILKCVVESPGTEITKIPLGQTTFPQPSAPRDRLPAGKLLHDVRVVAGNRNEQLTVRDAQSCVDLTTILGRADELAARLADAGVQRGERLAVDIPMGIAWLTAVLAILEAEAAIVLAVDRGQPVPGGRVNYRLSLEDQTIGIAGQPSGKAVNSGAAPLWLALDDLAGPATRYAGLRSPSVMMQSIESLGAGPWRSEGAVRVITKSGSPNALFSVFWPLLRGRSIDLCGATQGTAATAGGVLYDTSVGICPRDLSAQGPTVLVGDPQPMELLSQAETACVISLYAPQVLGIPIASIQGMDPHWALQLSDSLVDVELRLLSQHQQPVPAKVPAELMLVSPKLEDGTQPLVPTGDWVKRRPDGRLGFLGRKNNARRRRGFLTDTRLTEQWLALEPDVEQAAVRFEPANGKSEPLLVAYAAPSDRLSAEDLLASAAEILPRHLRPDLFRLLPSLPCDAEGRADISQLPAAAPGEIAAAEFSPARTPTEATLCRIWCEVLDLAAVGIHESFFDLGGNSLASIRVLARIKDQFSTDLSIHTLFEADTVAALATRLAGDATSESASEVDSTLAIEPDVAPDDEPAGNETAEELVPQAVFPLSYSQERLWFLDQLQPGTPLYNLAFGVALPQPLKIDVVNRVLTEIVNRHDVLRTSFDFREGAPCQIVHGPTAFEAAVVDLREQSAETAALRVAEVSQENAMRPFNLTQIPLLRCTVVQTDDESFSLLCCFHHIVSDGWSVSVFLRELQHLFACYGTGQPSALPALPMQYAEFSVRQREWLQGETLSRLNGYWENQLRDLPTTPAIRLDHPRPNMESFRGAAHHFRLTEGGFSEIQTLCRKLRVTPYMLVLAALKSVLARYSSESDIVLGTPVANRTLPATEELIGFFANTLVLRTQVEPELTFRELVLRVKQVTLDAQSHQDLPFERLVKHLQPERSLGNNPLFQVMFIYQSMKPADQGRSATRADESDGTASVSTGTSKFDLTIAVAEAGDGLLCGCEFNTDILEAETVARLVRMLRQTLAAGVAEPERRLADLPPAVKQLEEIERLSVEECQPGNDDRTALERFEAAAAANPQATALTDRERSWTYAELNSAANRLARRLVGLGIGPDNRVLHAFPRGGEAILAVLAVLKAGAAYVPIDVTLPLARLQYVFTHARASCLLASSGDLAAQLPRHDLPAVIVDDERDELARLPDQNIGLAVEPLSLVYVIFTSGSTGIAKGVEMNHLCVENLLRWQDQVLGNDRPRILHFAPLSFDVSYQEIFAALGNAGALIVADEDQRRDPGELLRLIQRTQVERIYLPFVALQQLAQKAVALGCPALNLTDVVTAGETLKISGDISHWISSLDKCRLHNQYGPSETHIVTHYTLPANVQRWTHLPPIGRPTLGATMLVVDDRLNPVPAGAVGEVCVGGEAVGRGYLDNPRETAAAFVPNPFDKSGGRMYRTGDLARFRTDGQLEFLGRNDHQVKIRGFRVEPGEIEHALRECDGIRDAVVVCDDSESSQRKLLAYLLPDRDFDATMDFHSYLSTKIPEYMLPAAFFVRNEFPLTGSGKVDRRRLASGDGQKLHNVRKRISARNPVEAAVIEIYQEVLEIDDICVNDDFFRLGGHSLLTVKVCSRIRQRLGVELPVRCIFDTPRAAELARTIVEQQSTHVDASELRVLLTDLTPVAAGRQPEEYPS